MMSVGERSEEELERIHLLETAFDPGTVRWLERARVPVGAHCLAIGAGTYGVLQWLTEEIGPKGTAIAIDTSAKSWCLPSTESPQTSPSEIAAFVAARGPFDLVHARFALLHAPDRADIFSAIVAAVKPGGLLLLEEPDFGCARVVSGPENLRKSFNNVHSAIELLFANLYLDHAFGAGIPGLLQDAGFDEIAIENDAAIVPGGSPLACVMSMTATQLATAFIATSFATLHDVTRYRAFAADRTCWATYQATVRGIARRVKA